MNVPIASHNIRFPGYGAFWVANSITSTVMGWRSRSLQKKAQEHNQEFQLEMERAKTITEDKKLQEEIAFKRRLLDLSRQYRQEETMTSFNAQMQAIELRTYLQYCWPLDATLPYVVLQEINGNSAPIHPRLNVILRHSQLLPQKKHGGINDGDAGLFEELEYSFEQEASFIGDIKFRKDAAKGSSAITGSNASIMNIHFLMSQIPTLVIAPYYNAGKICFNGAVWEPQAARPMIRPLLSFDYEPIQAANDDKYRKQKMDLFHAATSVIAGSVRDSYMLLTQGKAPTMPEWLNDARHKKLKQIAMSEKSFKQFIQQENNNVLAALDEENMPHLLEVFHKEDVENMKEQVESNNQKTL